jgi:hypothetical protein
MFECSHCHKKFASPNEFYTHLITVERYPEEDAGSEEAHQRENIEREQQRVGVLRRAYMAGLDMGENGLEDGEKLDSLCREDRFLEWLSVQS